MKLYHKGPYFLLRFVSLFVSDPVKSLRQHKPRLQLTARVFSSGLFVSRLLSVVSCSPRIVLKTLCALLSKTSETPCGSSLIGEFSSHSHVNKHTQKCQNLSLIPDLWSPLTHFTFSRAIQRSGIPLKMAAGPSRINVGCLNSYFALWSSSSLPYYIKFF